MSVHPISRPSARRRFVARGATLALVLFVAACGSGDDGNVVADVTKDNELPTQSAPVTTAPPDCEAAEKELTEEDKPTVEAPGGERPTELGIEDLTEGEGRAAEAGEEVKLQYTGILFDDGTEFDTSWDDLQPLPVTVGAGGVIPGFDQGLEGLKLGGRRQLIIPAELGYGAEGSPPAIGPDEDLVFVIDLVEICTPAVVAPEDPLSLGSTVPEGEGAETTAPAEGAETTAPAEGEGAETTAPAEGEGSETTAPAEDATTTTAADAG